MKINKDVMLFCIKRFEEYKDAHSEDEGEAKRLVGAIDIILPFLYEVYDKGNY